MISAFLAPFTSAKSVNAYSYEQLENRLSQLEANLFVIQTTTSEMLLKPYQRHMLETLYDSLSALHRFVYTSTERLHWVRLTGYITAWDRLHRAEETLIEIEPIEMVIRDANHDQMAINASKMSNAKELLDKLRSAEEVLGFGVRIVFTPDNTSSETIELPRELNQNIKDFDQRIRKSRRKRTPYCNKPGS